MAEAWSRGGRGGRSRASGSARSSENGRNGDRRAKPRGGRGRATRGDAVRAESDRDLDWRRRDPPLHGGDRSRPVAAPAKVDSAALMQCGPMVGECLAMCSPEEARSRQEIKDISRFESPPSSATTQQSKGDASWTVKKYRRPAAGRLDIDALDLRPPRVLCETLDHLFTNVLPWPGHGFDWKTTTGSVHDFLGLYHFLSDRVRAVRQDFVVQRVRDRSRVVALVQIARFYVVASFRALQVIEDASDKTLDWSEPLNDQQLASALTEVHALYPSAADETRDADNLHEEAVAYDVLLHLRDPRAVSLLLLKVPLRLRRRVAVGRVLALFVAFHTSDVGNCLRLFRELPVVQQCLALRHLPIVWTTRMRHMNKAYGKTNRFELSEIAAWAGLPCGDDARLLCTAMNIHIEDEAPPGIMDSDSWEDVSCRGYAIFKITAIRDELEVEVEKTLLRRKAVSIQKEVLQRSTATTWIMES